MDTVLRSDIFFFIVAIESVILTLLVAVAFFYIIRTGRELNRIAISLRERVTESETYVAELKDRLDSNFFFRLVFPMRKKSSQRNDSFM